MILKLRWAALLLGLLGCAVLLAQPFHNAGLRYGLPHCLFATWGAAVMLAWPRKLLRFFLLLLPLLAVVPFVLPAKPYDKEELRARYLAEMKSMDGVLYVWGGEGAWGVDCSGLPRRGLRGALLDQGWRHANGEAFREWARQWWFDESAKAMSEGYLGRTRPTGLAGVLRRLDLSKLNPGDLAVNAGRSHVMVYVGEGQWIQADPGPMKVFIADPKDHPSSWFDSKVDVFRWSVLE